MEIPGKADDAFRAKLAGAAGIALAGVAALSLLIPQLREPVTFDGVNVYLPMARRLLEEGPRYFQDADSVRIAPVAYGYPALFAASEAWVRWANLVSFTVAVMLLGAAAWRAHSMRAGVVTAFLAAASPLLRRWVPDVMTEPPFIFLIALWLFSVGRLIAGGGKAWVALAGLALGLAALTRPAASLFTLIMCAWFAVRAWRARADARQLDLRIAVAHLLSSLIWGAWLLHNTVSFGFPAIAGGAGVALWLGINPLTGGWDPLYVGLDYDDGALTGGLNPLSIEGDRMLGAAARLEIADTRIAQLATLMALKALAFVFVPPVEVFAYRGWRIFLLVMAFAALWLDRRSRMVRIAAAFALYMLVVHLPMLFTVRYSIGALDVALVFLGGIGVAELRTTRRVRIVIPVLLAAFAMGWLTFRAPPPGPRIESRFIEPRWRAQGGDLPAHLSRAHLEAPGVIRLSKGAVVELEVSHAPRLNVTEATLTMLDIALSRSRDSHCSSMRLRYRSRSQAGYEAWRNIKVAVHPDGEMHRYVLGTTVPLHLAEEGVLRMDFDCTGDATLTLGEIQVFAQVRGAIYRARLAQSQR